MVIEGQTSLRTDGERVDAATAWWTTLAKHCTGLEQGSVDVVSARRQCLIASKTPSYEDASMSGPSAALV